MFQATYKHYNIQKPKKQYARHLSIQVSLFAFIPRLHLLVPFVFCFALSMKIHTSMCKTGLHVRDNVE